MVQIKCYKSKGVYIATSFVVLRLYVVPKVIASMMNGKGSW